MTEIHFYPLQRQSLEAVLPSLLQKSLERGWRAVVQAASPERIAALDDHLGTYEEHSFLPHGTDAEPDATTFPVVLTAGEGNPNGAQIRFQVDGTRLPADAAASGYERVVLVFDGNDDEALAQARADWRGAKASGAALFYWQQDDGGRWDKKA